MSTSKKPAYRAVSVHKRGDQEVFTEIGAVWATKGEGFAVRLNALPIGDTILLRPVAEKSAKESVEA